MFSFSSLPLLWPLVFLAVDLCRIMRSIDSNTHTHTRVPECVDDDDDDDRLYMILSLRIIMLLVDQEDRKKNSQSNRRKVLYFVLAGCVVRLVYVDLSDLYVNMPIEVEYLMAAVKELLFVSATAFLVFYWKEIQVSMQAKTNKTVDKLRSQLFGCIGSFAAVRVLQLICECAGSRTAAQVFKASAAHCFQK